MWSLESPWVVLNDVKAFCKLSVIVRLLSLGGSSIVSNYVWASLRKISGAYQNVLEGLENVSVGSFGGLWKLQKH